MKLLTDLWGWFKPRLTTGHIVARVLYAILAFYAFLFAILPAIGVAIVGAVDRKQRLSPNAKTGTGIAVGVALLLGISALGGGGRATADKPAPSNDAAAVASSSTIPGHLTIAAPSDGTQTDQETVEVSGTAPSGATVVRDVALANDESTVAGSDGTWSMTVALKDGVNQLTFRIGDDRSTEMTLTVVRAAPATSPSEQATPAPSATATASASPTAEPTPEPTPEATPEPTPEPTPAPRFATFEDGTWEVGADIRAGTYRLQESTSFCYWARLKGFGGTLNDIIANENVNGFGVVTIGSKDAGFESNGCGEWTKDLSRVTENTSRLDEDGTYIVGTDMKVGKWRSTGGDYCYWARLKGFGGTLNDIIANDNVLGGRTIVTIRSTDKGFKTSGCGTWTRG